MNVCLRFALTIALTPCCLFAADPSTVVIEEEVVLVMKENVAQQQEDVLKRVPETDHRDMKDLFAIKAENANGKPIPQRRTFYANLETGQIRVEIKDLRDLRKIIQQLKVPAWQIINLDTSHTYIIEGREASRMLSIKTTADGSKRATWLPISPRMTALSRWLIRIGIFPDDMQAIRNAQGLPTRLETRFKGELHNEILLEKYVIQEGRSMPRKITEKSFPANGEGLATTSKVSRVELNKPIPAEKFAIPENLTIEDPMRMAGKKQPEPIQSGPQ